MQDSKNTGYTYLHDLMEIHQQYLSSDSSERHENQLKYYFTCEKYWNVISRTPLRVGSRWTKNKRLARRQTLKRLEPEHWLRLQDWNWKSYLWEDLSTFLPQNLPVLGESQYLWEFIKVVNCTYERAMTNLLTYDFGLRLGKTRIISLDEPMNNYIGETLPDPRPVVQDSGLCSEVQKELDLWVEARIARRSGREELYQRIAIAWMRRNAHAEGIREMWKAGDLGKNEDHFRDCLNQITEKVQSRLIREGYRPSPGVQHAEAA